MPAILMALAALQPATPFAGAVKEIERLSTPYLVCARDTAAAAAATTDESGDLIVDAALGSCTPKARKARQDMIAKMTQLGFSPGEAESSVDAGWTTFETAARRIASGAVVYVRARRR